MPVDQLQHLISDITTHVVKIDIHTLWASLVKLGGQMWLLIVNRRIKSEFVGEIVHFRLTTGYPYDATALQSWPFVLQPTPMHLLLQIPLLFLQTSAGQYPITQSRRHAGHS